MATQNITVTLTAYNMGPHATETDFDQFAAYVGEQLEDRVDFDANITVDQFPFANSGHAEDGISGATDEQRETIRDALRDLWESWCGTEPSVVEVSS